MTQKIISDFFKEFNNDNQGQQEVWDRMRLTQLKEPPQESFKGQLITIEDIIRYTTAGNATITLKSMKTNTRFTYKIQKPKEINKNSPVSFFVKLINGPDNHIEIWHSGSCGRCGRTLTVPESVLSGFGPECINKMKG